MRNFKPFSLLVTINCLPLSPVSAVAIVCVSSQHDSVLTVGLGSCEHSMLHMGRVRGHLLMSKYHREVNMEPGQSVSQSIEWSAEKNYWPLLESRYLTHEDV